MTETVTVLSQQTGMAISRACELVGLPRSTYYRLSRGYRHYQPVTMPVPQAARFQPSSLTPADRDQIIAVLTQVDGRLDPGADDELQDQQAERVPPADQLRDLDHRPDLGDGDDQQDQAHDEHRLRLSTQPPAAAGGGGGPQVSSRVRRRARRSSHADPTSAIHAMASVRGPGVSR